MSTGAGTEDEEKRQQAAALQKDADLKTRHDNGCQSEDWPLHKQKRVRAGTDAAG